MAAPARSPRRRLKLVRPQKSAAPAVDRLDVDARDMAAFDEAAGYRLGRRIALAELDQVDSPRGREAAR
jgi:hypothetical protein